MSRQIRIQFPGAVYHVTARGNEGQCIFKDDVDRRTFLSLLGQVAKQHGVLIHAFCLMSNHYHLALETPRGNLSQSIGWLQVTYTIRFNRRHKRYGHLFQGRFKAILVDADAYAYALTLYVHLNLIRPKDKNALLPVEKKQLLDEYPWSSHQAYAGITRKPEWLNISWLQYWGKNTESAQKAYRNSVQEMFFKPVYRIWDDIQYSLVLGGNTLLKKVQQIVKDKKGQEEKQWAVRREYTLLKDKLKEALKKEEDKRIQVWARVRIAGERLVDVGKDFGYKDGSGVLQTIKRLELKAKTDKEISNKLSQLESFFLSSVKS